MQQFSRTKVTKAGKALRDEDYHNERELEKLMGVLSFWRYEHDLPLKSAFQLIQDVALNIDKSSIFGSRLKRLSSIVKKLQRWEKMKLGNMRDIGGCRVIVSGEAKLRKVVRALRKDLRFKDEDGSVRCRDYIEEPKPDGYRSYHLFGKFLSSTGSERFIEVQVRTIIQHDWATALEIVDLFTKQALKSNVGKEVWKHFFRTVSQQFAVMDSISNFTRLSEAEQLLQYKNRILANPDLIEACAEAQSSIKAVNAIKRLNGFAQSFRIIEDHINKGEFEGYVLIKLDVENRKLESEMFRLKDGEQAEKKYTALETKYIDDDTIVIALISTAKVNNIKDAYPNFFGDSTDFLHYLRIINSFDARRARPGLLLRILNRAGLNT